MEMEGDFPIENPEENILHAILMEGVYRIKEYEGGASCHYSLYLEIRGQGSPIICMKQS